ncbi:hypothetical protein [Massilia timonae]|uniref:hypothetical protein n=1 Tax=Massilia timonae TaxID=47229 RepID=UPI0028D7A502|nr:hypothetical protein [Massilia timonae]
MPFSPRLLSEARIGVVIHDLDSAALVNISFVTGERDMENAVFFITRRRAIDEIPARVETRAGERLASTTTGCS